jgi:hypothetical protein
VKSTVTFIICSPVDDVLPVVAGNHLFRYLELAGTAT